MLSEISINNSKRKDLALALAEKGLVVIPLKYRGKIPYIKEWQKKTKTTVEEADNWFTKNPAQNLGLVLGSNSGIVAIDVDGEGGKPILDRISGGILPDTVQFTTGGGGIRYLYKIPDSHKGNAFKKYSENDPSTPHTECALMSDGQQTVLPYSVHENGNLYKFCTGKSFDEIELTEAPQWIIAKMTKGTSADKEEVTATSISTSPTSEKIVVAPQNIPPYSVSAELAEVLSRCETLKKLFDEQITTGLTEDKWFLVMSLLVACELEELAVEFSKMSAKHNTRSEKRIALLVQDRSNNNISACIRCCTLGCTAEQIADCMGYVNKNKKGEIANSPRKLISNNIAYNIQIGFKYDINGNFAGINGNIFARHILDSFTIRIRTRDIFYLYEDSYWKKMETAYVLKLLYAFFNSYEQDKWSNSIENSYFSPFIRMCEYVSELVPPVDYICLKNGVFDLNTFQLEEHTEKLFCTVQLKINYDPKVDCPLFRAFLKDILNNDNELFVLVQEIIGYCMCYKTKAHKFFILIGEGKNGKSVFCEVLSALCDRENVSSIPLSALSNDFKLAQIVDKVLNVSTENEMVIDKSSIQMIKALASGDQIQINQKYEKSYSYTPYAKFVFATNRLPIVTDKSFGFNRRVIIIPFDKRYSANPKFDEGLEDKSMQEKLLNELDGIFNFAIEGLKRLIANDFNFSESAVVNELLDEYKLDLNPFLDFIRSNIDITTDNTDRIETLELHKAFTNWCDRNNHDKLAKITPRMFLKEIRATFQNEGVAKDVKSNGKQYFHYVKFNGEWLKANSITPVIPLIKNKPKKVKSLVVNDIKQI